MRTLLPFIALLCASPAMAGLVFTDGDPIVNAVWNSSAGEYKLNAEAFIDLSEIVTRRDNNITVTYQTLRGSTFLTVARSWTLTDEDIRAGMDWGDQFASGQPRIYFGAEDHIIRNVEVWTLQRGPGVSNEPASIGTLKARF